MNDNLFLYHLPPLLSIYHSFLAPRACPRTQYLFNISDWFASICTHLIYSPRLFFYCQSHHTSITATWTATTAMPASTTPNNTTSIIVISILHKLWMNMSSICSTWRTRDVRERKEKRLHSKAGPEHFTWAHNISTMFFPASSPCPNIICTVFHPPPPQEQTTANQHTNLLPRHACKPVVKRAALVWILRALISISTSEMACRL